MRIFLIIVGICFVWLSSAFYVTGHPFTPLLPGDVFIQKTGNTVYLPFLTSVIAGIVVMVCVSLFRKIIPLLQKAPSVIFLVIVISVLTIGWYGYQLRTSLFSCNKEHQVSLDTIIAQSQTVLASHKDGCLQSYSVLTDWNVCTEKAGEVVPVSLQFFIRPLVSNIMMFFREKIKDIEVLKHEHDDRCQGYTELLFFPPDVE